MVIKWFQSIYHFIACCSILLLIISAPQYLHAQNVKLEQGQNGGVGLTPIDPIEWITGNANSGKAHYSEGQSIPYRVVLTGVSPGNHSLVVEWDIRKDNKSAIDFITSYQQIDEVVNPTAGLSGSFSSPSYFAIPTPQSNVLTPGLYGDQMQPFYSFNQLPSAQRRMAAFNGTINNVS